MLRAPQKRKGAAHPQIELNGFGRKDEEDEAAEEDDEDEADEARRGRGR